MGVSPRVTKEDLIEKFGGFAQATAHKLAKDLPIDIEDAISAANEGLVQAANKFDIERAMRGMAAGIGPLETNFKSLAFLRIRGAILDEVRRNTFVKRRGYEQGIHFEMVPMDKTRSDDDGSAVPQLELSSYDEDTEYGVLRDLTNIEKEVIVGLAAGYSGLELAKRLGLTPSRVSQIGKKAKGKIAVYLSDQDESAII